MQEHELAKIFEQYDDYLDTMIGLNEHRDIQTVLHKFRKNLREEVGDCSVKEVHYLIEVKTFLKYLELCKKEK